MRELAPVARGSQEVGFTQPFSRYHAVQGSSPSLSPGLSKCKPNVRTLPEVVLDPIAKLHHQCNSGVCACWNSAFALRFAQCFCFSLLRKELCPDRPPSQLPSVNPSVPPTKLPLPKKKEERSGSAATAANTTHKQLDGRLSSRRLWEPPSLLLPSFLPSMPHSLARIVILSICRESSALLSP